MTANRAGSDTIMLRSHAEGSVFSPVAGSRGGHNRSPAECDLLVRPIPHEIRAGSQDNVQMIAHHGIAADIDRENRRKLLEAFANPLLAMLIVVLG